jgi:hypothetical protein
MSELSPKAPDVRHPSPERGKVSPWLILASWALAPAVWTLQVVGSYLLTSKACYPGYGPLSGTRVPDMSDFVLFASLVALGLAALAFWLALIGWRRTRCEKKGGAHHALDAGEGRTRFLALCGLIISTIFAAAIVFEALSAIFLQNCLNAAGQ